MKIPKPINTMQVRPYGWQLALFDNRDQFVQYATAVGHKDVPPPAGVGCCWTDTSNKLAVIGVFRDASDAPAMPGTLAHELAHLVIAVFEHVGMPITEPGSEAFTYLLSDMFDPCYEALILRDFELVRRVKIIKET